MDLKKIFKKSPLDKFQITYSKLTNQDNIPIDLKIMHDLKIVRDQIIVHPPARSIKLGTGVIKGRGLTYDEKSKTYNKLKNLPNILSEFDMNNAIEFYNNIKFFLNEYYCLIKNVFHSSTLDYYFELREII
jgi:hypothetical protein